jgi:hypothetical protein
MLEIKTILNDLNEAADFDKNVNAALADGWKLVRRDVLPGWEGDTTVAYRKLYAELERETEPEEEELTPASWLTSLTTFGYTECKCSACGAITVNRGNILPSRCSNCKRPMTQTGAQP